jgi:hypothetical protein
LALDEPRKDDQRVDHQGIPFVIGQELDLWVRMGRTMDVRYDKDTDSFFVRLSGPKCC